MTSESDLIAQQRLAADVWACSSHDDKKREHSHWRGFGRYADDRAWLAIGTRVRRELDVFRRSLAQPPLAPGAGLAVLEWGPGGGSNVVALAPVSRRYVGVDISGPNLDECRTQAEQAGFGDFTGVHLTGAPADAMAPYRESFDIVLSTAVFQHFPSKEYGVAVLHALSGAAKPGGLGLIQIRYDNGNPRFLPKSGDYASHYITATSYAIDEFWQLLGEAGFEPLQVRNIRPDVNYASFMFRRVS